MKKLIVFILILSILSSTAFFKYDKNPIWQVDGLQKVCFVTNVEIEGLDNVECGDLFFNYVAIENAKNNFNQYKKDAKSIQFYIKNCNLQYIFNQIKYESCEEQQINGRTIYLGTSPYFDDFIWVGDNKINLQIVCCEDEIIVGCPAILTGF